MAKRLTDDLKRQLREMDKLVNQQFPDFLRDEFTNLVDSSFSKEQYQDQKSSKWAGRKKKDKKGAGRRALLVGLGGGDLIKSIEITHVGRSVLVRSDKSYAQIHNEGLKGLAFGKHSFQMPKRQYMPKPGDVPPFDKGIVKFLDKRVNKIYK